MSRAHRLIRRIWAPVMLAFFSLTIVGPFLPANAAALTATATLGNAAPNATTSVTFSFTVGTEVSNGGWLVLSKPATYPNFPSPANPDTHVSVTVNGNAAALNQVNFAVASVSMKIGNSPYAAGSAVVVTIASTAGITNPATEQGYNWELTTQNAAQNTVFDVYTASNVQVTSGTTTTLATTTTLGATTTTAAGATTTTAAGATTTTAAGATTTTTASSPGLANDPRSSADEDITDFVKIDLSPTDDSSKLGGTVGIRPGPDDPALQLIAIYIQTITNDVVSSSVRKSSTVSASPEVNVGVSYSGADYNKPEVWKTEGFGEDCWKIDWTTTEYLHPLPTPSVTSGRNLTGWTYTNVIVKAGSVTDPSLQVNTIFKAPAVGAGVFADVNKNGISDPGGRTGDKAISHVVYCGKSGSATSTTAAGQGASTTVAPTTTGASTTTGAPTTTRATTTSTQAPTTTRATSGGSGGRATTTTVPGSKEPIEVAMTTDPKVTLCHRTSSKTNPYVTITVDASAVLKEGHGSHTGPLFPEKDWGDIIPAFGDYPGLNWPAGQYIYDAGCDFDKAEANRNQVATTVVGKDGKVTLCHRTSSKTNPYVTITVDASAVLKEGHGSHTGPLFPEDDWGDIIPAFEGYAGLNWPGGYQIWNNDCKPVTSTTTTTPTRSTLTPAAVTTTTRPGATTTTLRPGVTTTTVRATTTTTRTGVTTVNPIATTTTLDPGQGGGSGNRATTTTTVAPGQWDPAGTLKLKTTAATLRKRAACAESSVYESSITQVQMLLSRGTSQEVVQFEVCMNSFKAIAANTPLAAFGESAIEDPLVEGLAVPAVGGGTGMLWPALSLVAVGWMLLLAGRRFEN